MRQKATSRPSEGLSWRQNGKRLHSAIRRCGGVDVAEKGQRQCATAGLARSRKCASEAWTRSTWYSSWRVNEMQVPPRSEMVSAKGSCRVCLPPISVLSHSMGTRSRDCLGIQCSVSPSAMPTTLLTASSPCVSARRVLSRAHRERELVTERDALDALSRSVQSKTQSSL
jgi:ribosomal protein L37E